MSDEALMWSQLTERDRDGENARIFVQFAMHAQKDEAKSLESGRPIFNDVPYVKIMVPGDLSNIIHRPVRESDKQRFRRQWQDFEAGREQGAQGTPLKEWPAITRGQVEELAHFKVLTVEALAALPDGLIANIGPIQALKQKAIDFLERAKGAAPIDKLRAEMAEKDAEVQLLKKQLEEQVALTKSLSEAAPRPASAGRR